MNLGLFTAANQDGEFKVIIKNKVFSYVRKFFLTLYSCFHNARPWKKNTQTQPGLTFFGDLKLRHYYGKCVKY